MVASLVPPARSGSLAAWRSRLQVSRFQHDPTTQVVRPNETVDGLDATTEALRHAAEDTPSGADPGDIEKTPVFDRAGAAPKI